MGILSLIIGRMWWMRSCVWHGGGGSAEKATGRGTDLLLLLCLCCRLIAVPFPDSRTSIGSLSSDEMLPGYCVPLKISFCNEYSVPKDKLDHFKNITAHGIVCLQVEEQILLTRSWTL
ncbi:unnamed protein product [Urochloa humidicola]